MKENKFVMGEEVAAPGGGNIPQTPQPTASHSTTKKPTRHHVKRRSSGRVQVTKLAPMARANAAHTDSEADFDDNNGEASSGGRPTMRRSQSQRSLHRMSFGGERKGFSAITTASPTSRRKSTASEKVTELVVSSPSPPTPEDGEVDVPERPQQQKRHSNNEVSGTSSSNSTTHSSSNPASLSSRAIAAPVEQPIYAVANNLVVPKKNYPPIIAKSSSPLKSEVTKQEQKQFLKSQFIPSSYEDEQGQLSSSLPKRYDSQFHMTPGNSHTTTPNSRSPKNTVTGVATIARTNSNPNMLSRTQQKLMLQRQQVQVEDETSALHPRNMLKINKELECLSKQYKCLKRYQDPMRASLVRCLEKKSKKPESRLQLGANKYSMSMAIIPTINATTTVSSTSSNNSSGNSGYIPHLEQKKQIAQQQRKRQHHHEHLKEIALQRQQQQQLVAAEAAAEERNKDTNGVIWNATASFLDKVFSTK
jgi:hypothetical protein